MYNYDIKYSIWRYAMETKRIIFITHQNVLIHARYEKSRNKVEALVLLFYVPMSEEKNGFSINSKKNCI